MCLRSHVLFAYTRVNYPYNSVLGIQNKNWVSLRAVKIITRKGMVQTEASSIKASPVMYKSDNMEPDENF